MQGRGDAVMLWFSLCLCVAAGACVGLVRTVAPGPPQIGASVKRWELERDLATRRHHGSVSSDWSSRVAEWCSAAAARRGVDLGGLWADLAVCGRSPADLVVSTVTVLALGCVAPSVLTGLLVTLGVPAGPGLPVVGGLGLGAAGVAVTYAEVRRHAKLRREELRRGLSMYLNLVAMAMEAGRAHEEALPAAARIGHGWVFDELADALRRSRVSGTPVWRAYVELGRRYAVVELVDLGQALALATREGASVRTTLQARAAAMRTKRLDSAETRATEASSSMSIVLLMVGVLFVAYNLYPGLAGL